jgi:hypothetical protein
MKVRSSCENSKKRTTVQVESSVNRPGNGVVNAARRKRPIEPENAPKDEAPHSKFDKRNSRDATHDVTVYRQRHKTIKTENVVVRNPAGPQNQRRYKTRAATNSANLSNHSSLICSPAPQNRDASKSKLGAAKLAVAAAETACGTVHRLQQL